MLAAPLPLLPLRLPLPCPPPLLLLLLGLEVADAGDAAAAAQVAKGGHVDRLAMSPAVEPTEQQKVVGSYPVGPQFST